MYPSFIYNDHSNTSIIAYSVARQVTKYKLLCPRSTVAINYIILCSVCEKFQTTRAKVAPVIFIYGSHFSATEATYKVSLKMVNFVEFARTFTRIRLNPVPDINVKHIYI